MKAWNSDVSLGVKACRRMSADGVCTMKEGRESADGEAKSLWLFFVDVAT